MSDICRYDHNNDGDCHIHPKGCAEAIRADGGGKTYYELHVTYLDVEDAIPPQFPYWSHSVIAGDIILGEGRKQYLTAHFHRDSDRETMIADMEFIAQSLRALGKTVLRTKVELVVYDRRTER